MTDETSENVHYTHSIRSFLSETGGRGRTFMAGLWLAQVPDELLEEMIEDIRHGLKSQVRKSFLLLAISIASVERMKTVEQSDITSNLVGMFMSAVIMEKLRRNGCVEITGTIMATRPTMFRYTDKGVAELKTAKADDPISLVGIVTLPT